MASSSNDEPHAPTPAEPAVVDPDPALAPSQPTATLITSPSDPVPTTEPAPAAELPSVSTSVPAPKEPAAAPVAAPVATPSPSAVEVKEYQPGLLVTAELEKALDECKAKVARIARDCRAKNRKFRDNEFDLENDQYACLHGLDFPSSGKFVPSDVQRVTQIFDRPQFFVNGADCNDIVQGRLGDCWFLSALATMTAAKGLVEKFCVARDEQVGVYGFVFFRDNRWVNVVIDDMLYTCVPKYEELTNAEKELYHEDKEKYNASARKGGKTLYFAKSGGAGETWVPLIEKAYAKLHGDYVALVGGKAAEAVEDLTGGVSTVFRSRDILDQERFWNDELLRANKDRILGCSFDTLDSSRSGLRDVTVDGLIGSHAYSVLRARECKGRRFIVLRNPWGKSDWTGRWSNGSKEWTAEWLEVLPMLEHEFGNDGQFVMEYCDFLTVWEHINRTMIFDSSWMMSSQWLQVPIPPLPAAWSFGDVSFTFTIPKPTFAIIVLSQVDTRYFKEISGSSYWGFDFVLVKRGEKEPIGHTTSAILYPRSVNLEAQLEAGEYVVYVRVERTILRDIDYYKKGVDSGWDHRKLSKILTERAKSRSIASNFKPGIQKKYIPTELSELIERDLALYEKQKEAEKVGKTETVEKDNGDGTKTVTVTTVTTTTMTKTETTVTKQKPDGSDKEPPPPVPNTADPTSNTANESFNAPDYMQFMPTSPPSSPVLHSAAPSPPPPPAPQNPLSSQIEIQEDENSVFLGLRLYTNKEAPAVITGQLKADSETFAK